MAIINWEYTQHFQRNPHCSWCFFFFSVGLSWWGLQPNIAVGDTTEAFFSFWGQRSQRSFCLVKLVGFRWMVVHEKNTRNVVFLVMKQGFENWGMGWGCKFRRHWGDQPGYQAPMGSNWSASNKRECWDVRLDGLDMIPCGTQTWQGKTAHSQS